MGGEHIADQNAFKKKIIIIIIIIVPWISNDFQWFPRSLWWNHRIQWSNPWPASSAYMHNMKNMFSSFHCSSMHIYIAPCIFSRLYIGVTLRHYRQSPCEKHTNHTGRHCHAWKPWNSKIPPDLFSLQICEASQNTKVTHKTYKIIWIVSTWHGLKLWNLTWLYPSLCHTNLSMLMVLPISQTLWHGPILIILQNR